MSEYINHSLSDLHQMSLDIADRVMKRNPDTWKEVLGRHNEYKEVCDAIDLKKQMRSGKPRQEYKNGELF